MQHWNVFITVGAFILGASQIFFLVNFFWSLFAGKKAEQKSLAGEHARVGRADAAAAWQLRRHADRLPRRRTNTARRK